MFNNDDLTIRGTFSREGRKLAEVVEEELPHMQGKQVHVIVYEDGEIAVYKYDDDEIGQAIEDARNWRDAQR